LNIDKMLEELTQERQRLEEAIRALESIGGKSASKRAGGKGRRHMSAEARRRIGLAMKKRWAERKKAERAA
jgi:hypothetical protein